MAIRIPKMPQAETQKAVAGYLAEPQARPMMRGVDVANLGASEPFPVYFASLSDLESGNLPTQPRRWRHLLVNGEGAIAEADIDPQGPRVVALHRGPRARGMVQAFEGAQSLDRVQQQDYELRLLESPAIYLVAIWLHAMNDDVLIAIEPDRTGLPLHEPVPLEQALPTLRERAAFVRKAAANNPGPSGA